MPHPFATPPRASPDSPTWLSVLRHFGAAVLAVLVIALAVNLLAMPVAQAQARPALRIGYLAPADGTPGVVSNYQYCLGERGFVQKNPQVVQALFAQD